MLSAYLIDVIILLLAAVIAVPLFQIARLGAVPGFLIAGVIIGPHGLGLIDKISEISNLAEIGVVLLLFVIGIELKPSRLWRMKRMVFGLGTLQVIATGLVIGSASYLLFDFSLRTALLVGPALALSSTAFVLQLLTEQKTLGTGYGRVSFAVLLLQDLAVVPLLALIPLLAMPELSIGEDIGLALAESILILGIVVVVGRYLLHPLLHRVALSRNPEVFTASALLIVLGTALVIEHVGFSMAMGAFIAGLLISDSAFKHQIMAEIQPFRGLLLGLFFMSMGMSLNLGLLIDHPVPVIGIVALLMLTKVAVLFPLVYLFRQGVRQSLAVSIVLAQSGEFALVLFSLARQSELLAETSFQYLLLVVLLSMLATPLLAHYAQRFLRERKSTDAMNGSKPATAPVVIAGFGRVGHRIGEMLSMAGEQYIALDSDVSVVEKERSRGHPVFFGDVCKPELLQAAGVGNARIIIVTLDDPVATEKVVSSLREQYPHVTILTRGHSLLQCRELRRLGASAAVSENVETSIALARMTMTRLGIGRHGREDILNKYRQAYQASINDTGHLRDPRKPPQP